MDGVINLFKPIGITSARALDAVRRVTGQRKSGHAGTLDPLADGVLVICLGRGTKLVERLMGLQKVYRAVARLDVTSPSLDAETPLQEVPVVAIPDHAAVLSALGRFRGTVMQAPPAVSALKIGGRPAYRLARAGRPPALMPRPVRIDALELRRYAWPEVEFEVRCGRGMYVRSLVRDIGAVLGAGGCLMGLRRLAVGPFTSAEAWTPERLSAAAPEDYLLPLERAQAMLHGALADGGAA